MNQPDNGDTTTEDLSDADIASAEAQYLVPTYRRPELVLARGEGMYLWDRAGARYLDFMSGIAVMALGHGDPAWVAAVKDQAETLVHVSNLFHTEVHVELARRLVERSFADRVFFCNSGAEANEAALKFARRWAGRQKEREETRGADSGSHGCARHRVLAFEGGFHGRTMGALSCTENPAYREPFAPLVGGVSFAPFNDLKAAAEAITQDTCAVLVEPVQGESGVRPATQAFLKGLRELCSERGALLIFDEVQCGLGRTGHLWAHEGFGVTPDIMTLAKPLAGGLPIGAVLCTEAVASAISPGDHGSTFAAGPLVCRAAQVVLDRVSSPELLDSVTRMGALLKKGLMDLGHPAVVEIRGQGLMVGMELSRPAAPVIAAARERGLLVIAAGERVVRMVPPLVVTEDQVREALTVLAASLEATDGISDGNSTASAASPGARA